jgi:tRNA threonylcarbamoyladenosine modification (KEOPS) complex  Pcc1 subunit
MPLLRKQDIVQTANNNHQSQGNMKYSSTTEIECGKDESDQLIKSLSTEIKSHKSDRAKISMKKGKSGIIILIQSEDIAALRAGFNSVTKLVSVFGDIKKIE